MYNFFNAPDSTLHVWLIDSAVCDVCLKVGCLSKLWIYARNVATARWIERMTESGIQRLWETVRDREKEKEIIRKRNCKKPKSSERERAYNMQERTGKHEHVWKWICCHKIRNTQWPIWFTLHLIIKTTIVVILHENSAIKIAEFIQWNGPFSE